MLQIFKTKLTQKKELAPDVFSFTFQCADPTEINFTAGQYVLLQVPQPEGFPRLKHYSISSSSSQKDSFELLAKIVSGGLASEYFKKLEVGSEAMFQGPAGMFVLKESPRDKIFLATGAGIAPIRSMLLTVFNPQSAIRNSSKFLLFWGLKEYKDVYYLEEFKELAKNNSNFLFVVCLSREQSLESLSQEDKDHFIQGRVTAGFEKIIDGIKAPSFDYYLCGDAAIVEDLRKYVLAKRAPIEQIVFEKFV